MVHPVSVRPVASAPASALIPSSRPGTVGEVFGLALPLVLQTLAETGMQFISCAFVGRLGVAELGALGLSWIWMWTLLAPLVGIATGIQVFVARHDGAGERELCGPWVWQASWLTLPAMLVWAALLIPLLPLLFSAIGAGPELHDQAVAYALARLPGAPFLLLDFALSSFFQGLGDTRTPLVAQVSGLAVNVLSSLVLIFGGLGVPPFGVAGAGFAHSLGSFTVVLVLLSRFFREPVRSRYATRPVLPDRAAMLRFARTSLPIGGQWCLDMTTFAVFSSIVARTGAASMAASQAVLQLISLSYMQAIAIGTASGTLVGRHIGARDVESARRSLGSALLLAIGVAGVLGIGFLLVPEPLLGLFVHEPEVVALARPLLVLGALFQLVDALGLVTVGALRGAGDTRWPFMVQAGLAWAVRLPTAYWVAVELQQGVLGAWSVELGYVAVLSTSLLLRVRAGHWKTICI